MIDRLVFGCARYEHFDGAETGVREMARENEQIALALSRADQWIDEYAAGPEDFAPGWDAWFRKFSP